MERTLFICREVDLFKIPPRTGRGHISGEWKIEDKIFTARCKVMSIGDALEVRLEDPTNGEIFGACPVPKGQREAAVENAVDSSRNFVLRIEDPATKRHAFLGMNFAERSHAFDFNVALTDFEKQLQREQEIKAAASSGGISTTSHDQSGMIPEAAALYRKQDLSLKDGQSISVSVKKKATGSDQGGFLERLGGGAGAATILPLAPPPSAPATAAFGASNFEQTHVQSQTAAAAAPPAVQAAAQPASTVVAATEEGWATF